MCKKRPIENSTSVPGSGLGRIQVQTQDAEQPRFGEFNHITDRTVQTQSAPQEVEKTKTPNAEKSPQSKYKQKAIGARGGKTDWPVPHTSVLYHEQG